MALCAVVVLLVAAGPHVEGIVLWDEESDQKGQQNRARSEQERRAGDDGTLKGQRDLWVRACCVIRTDFLFLISTHLICGVGHVGFGTLVWALGGVHFTELHVKQVEDEAVERRTQAVT